MGTDNHELERDYNRLLQLCNKMTKTIDDLIKISIAQLERIENLEAEMKEYKPKNLSHPIIFE